MIKYAIGFAAGVVAMWVFGPTIRKLVNASALEPYAHRLPEGL